MGFNHPAVTDFQLLSILLLFLNISLIIPFKCYYTFYNSSFVNPLVKVDMHIPFEGIICLDLYRNNNSMFNMKSLVCPWELCNCYESLLYSSHLFRTAGMRLGKLFIPPHSVRKLPFFIFSSRFSSPPPYPLFVRSLIAHSWHSFWPVFRTPATHRTP